MPPERHRATFSLVNPAPPTPGTLPDGHLERINALQAARGKAALRASDLIARPVRLFGNRLTSYSTRMPDADIQKLADQINGAGGPLLSAHVTDTTPIGTYYAAEVVSGDLVDPPMLGEPTQELWLDTWAYWLNDDSGQLLARQIDGGIINEASIGYWYDEAMCSITGASYWDSPYWAGHTYTIIDPETGVSTERLCFIWTTGNVEFAEGSLVYRGAYPGTRVGGQPANTPMNVAASAGAPSGPTPHTRFQIAAGQDMATTFQKARSENAPGKPAPASADPPPQEDSTVKLKLKLPDGSARDVEAPEVQALMDAQITDGETRGAQAERERIATSLGLTPKDAETTSALTTLAAQAKDGAQYRNDLLDELHSLSVTLSNDSTNAGAAADRARRAYNALDLSDIRAEVDRLRASRDALVPNAQNSIIPADEEPRSAYRDVDAV